MSTIVIAINDTTNDIMLEDLGKSIPALSQVTLTEYYSTSELSDVCYIGSDLYNAINEERIIINDGTDNLSKEDGLDWIILENKLKDHNLHDHIGIPTPPESGTRLLEIVDGTYDWIDTTGVLGDLPCIQIRRTTDYTFTSSWVDITFDVTDIENDASVIEHDNTYTDRILIKEDGYYEITYGMAIAFLAEAMYSVRVRKNDINKILGSQIDVLDANDQQEVGNSFISFLSSGDFITLQFSAVGTIDATAKAGMVMTAVKLEGSRGIRGESGTDGSPGTGSTINVEKDDVLVAGGVNTLNFEGDVTVVYDSTGHVTVDVIGSEFTDSACVQARRSTAFTLTTSYTDITFDITDEENDASVIEHNDIDTEKINIKEDGTYLILYDFSIDASTLDYASTHIEAQVNKNGIIAVDGSWAGTTTFNDSSIDGSPFFHNHLSNSCIASLLENDYITFQMKYSVNAANTATNGTFKVIKLEGVKGEKGEQGTHGTGSTINVEKDDVLVAGGVNTLNFEGDVTVVYDSTGHVTVDVIGYEITDLACVQVRRSSLYTLTTSYVDITFDITDEETDDTIIEHDNIDTEKINIKADGTYLIIYDFGISASTNAYETTHIEAQVNKNGTTAINGSWSRTTTFNDPSIDGSPLFHNHLSNSCIATLSNNDYITFQIKYSNEIANTATNGTFKVIKLDTIRGEDGIDGLDGEIGIPGPAGSGSTINVYDDGTPVDGTPFEILNFKGLTISDSTSMVTIDGEHNLDEHIDIPTKPTSGKKLLEVEDGICQWTNSFEVGGGSERRIFFRNYPTYNGIIYLLGWYIQMQLDPNTPITLNSGNIYTSTYDAFYSKIVFNFKSVSGAPFTIRITGRSIDEYTGVQTAIDTEDLNITATGYYKTSKSWIDKVRVTILESAKSCTFDIYRISVWDRGKTDFILKGCRLEFTPDQINWHINLRITKQNTNGNMILLHDINLNHDDVVLRADGNEPGKFQRLGYEEFIEGSNGGGIIMDIDQTGLGSFLMELMYESE